MELHPDFLALNQPRYDNVEIGDKVFSPVYGHGSVTHKDKRDESFRVRFENSITFWFGIEPSNLAHMLLFWEDPDAVWPARSRRKVQKEAWVNIDADGCKTFFDTQSEADQHAFNDRLVCVRIEYEVEE